MDGNPLVRLHLQRQLSTSSVRRFKRKALSNQNLVRRMRPQILDGHDGCVNRISWNASGSLLASGSDDCCIMLWPYGSDSPPTRVNTSHTNNLFGVGFMNDDTVLVSCAADGTVQTHSGDLENPSSQVYTCHQDRVKALDVDPDNGNVAFSAGEDGAVRQFDLRESHRCQRTSPCANAIINLGRLLGAHQGFGQISAMSVKVHPLDSTKLLVGSASPYVKLYDRRRLTLGTVSQRPGAESEPVASYSLPHLRTHNEGADLHATHVQFSTTGAQFLVSYHADHVYLFNTNEPSQGAAKVMSKPVGPPSAVAMRTERAMEYKVQGNEHFRAGSYTLAITSYSDAISLDPTIATLYSNRAAAFLQRQWAGDGQSALNDCDVALEIDPELSKAAFRRIKALEFMDRPREALEAAQEFSVRWPTQAPGKVNALIETLRATVADQGTTGEDRASASTSEDHRLVLESSQRYVGACNVQTDIKEASFYGDSMVLAGSDDGRVFLWHKDTGHMLHAWRADGRIVNCVQAHPHDMVIATSGIDDTVKLWRPEGPFAEDAAGSYEEDDFDIEQVARENHDRMRRGPLAMLPNDTIEQLMNVLGVDDPAMLLQAMQAMRGNIHDE